MVTLPIRYVFFSSCPTNLTFTGATTWSHSERVAYAAFLSGGKMLLTIMYTLYIYLLLCFNTDVFAQRVFCHVCSCTR